MACTGADTRTANSRIAPTAIKHIERALVNVAMDRNHDQIRVSCQFVALPVSQRSKPRMSLPWRRG